MTLGLATLWLEPAVVTRAFDDGNITRHPESHFLDVVVNDRSLRSTVGEPAGDLVTELNRPWLPSVPEALDRFFGQRPSEGPGGRARRAADLRRGRRPGVWTAHRGPRGPGSGGVVAGLSVGGRLSHPRRVEHLHQPVVFDCAQYEAAFADAYERVVGFPYDELAHHGRRFLWPWRGASYTTPWDAIGEND